MLKSMSACVAIGIATVITASSALAQEPAGRTILRKADLTGTNMEIIVGITEFKPGEVAVDHIHHGEEVFYILEGAAIELPDGRPVALAAGVTNVNVRNVPHGGGKIVGDKALKILTIHIVDKGKPLYDLPK